MANKLTNKGMKANMICQKYVKKIYKNSKIYLHSNFIEFFNRQYIKHIQIRHAIGQCE
jgi:hypothetical protein